MAYYFWHGLDFQGSRVSGAFKVPKRIDAIKKNLGRKGFSVPDCMKFHPIVSNHRFR